MTTTTEAYNTLQQQASLELCIDGLTKPIGGEVYTPGSKNATLRNIAVTVALPGIYRAENFPILLDTLDLLSLIESLGGSVLLDTANHRAVLDTRNLNNRSILPEETGRTTAAFWLAGAILGRDHAVQIGKPGGDSIGVKKIDQHVAGFEALGAVVTEGDRDLSATLAQSANYIQFRMNKQSTGAAVNYILALAGSGMRGALWNVPHDGDMTAMYELLIQAGVGVTVFNDHVVIEPVNTANQERRVDFNCAYDRNVAATWLAVGALSESGVVIRNVDINDQKHGLNTLRALGARVIFRDGTTVQVQKPLNGHAESVNVIAGTGDMYHSDWLPPLTVTLAKTPGRHFAYETAFSNRTWHAKVLQDMGADIQLEAGGSLPPGVTLMFDPTPDSRYILIINGSQNELWRPFNGALVNNVRASAAIAIAASQADGQSVLSNVHSIFRGYEHFDTQLRAIGIDAYMQNPVL